MKRTQLIVIYVVLLGVTGYFIYANLTTSQEDPQISSFYKYLEGEEVPTFCGDTIPLDSQHVRLMVEKELKKLVKYKYYTKKVIQRADIWLPRFEKIMIAHGLPTDLKYIAVIESKLKNVISHRGATGYWQFMPITGRKMGLEINGEVDERYDPIKSTRAACQYFKSAKDRLGKWTNAVGGYNMGVSGFQRQMEKQGKDYYYDLKLNRETRKYVYRAIAFKEIYENQEAYGIEKVSKLVEEPTYRIKVDSTIENLPELAHKEGITFNALVEFNPWIRGFKLSRKGTGKNYYLSIPRNKENYRLANPDNIADGS